VETYHPRRRDKNMEDPEDLLSVIRSGKHVTLAMCRDGKPYLATMNYAFDEAARCFYLHCSRKGKKIDYLRANPVVWGQILEDLEYLDGKCDHAYRTVQFLGRVEFVEDPEQRCRALSLMIDQLESDPEPMKKKHVRESDTKGVGILRIRVEAVTGKRGPA